MTINERVSLPLWWKIILLVISILLFSLQIVLIYFSVNLFYFQESYIGFGWAYIISESIGLLVTLFLIRKNINTNYKVTWIVLILLFPIPFTILYYSNQLSKKVSSRSYRHHQNMIPAPDYKDVLEELKEKDLRAYNMVSIINKCEPVCLYKNIKYTFFKDAKLKHEDMLNELNNAKKYIYLEYFIIASGHLMDSLYPVLLEKGKEGVDIRIIYDDLGSKGRLDSKIMKKLLKIPNCKIAAYQKIGITINLLANYRDHRKICVIDDKVVYCGGDNLADEYIHEIERFGYWRDNCGKFEGDIAKTFTRVFLSTWGRITEDNTPYISSSPSIEYEENGYFLPIWDGPTNDATPAYDLFCSMIESAERYIYISTPYFVIDDAMIALLARKIREGVTVHILMPHIPDKKTAFYMGRLNYREIYKAGGVVYEYEKGFNHAKNVIVDDKYAFIGTINMDYRSMFLHYECGTLIMHNNEIFKMKEDFESTIKESIAFDYYKWHKKKWYQRFIGYIFSLFAPMF